MFSAEMNASLAKPNTRLRPFSSHKQKSESKSTQIYSVPLNFYRIAKLAKKVEEFLTTIGLENLMHDYFEKPLFEDPFRNGVGLCLIVHKSFDVTIKAVCCQPKTVYECERNFRNAVSALLLVFSDEKSIPNIIDQLEDIMRGNYEIIFEFIAHLHSLRIRHIESKLTAVAKEASKQLDAQKWNANNKTKLQIAKKAEQRITNSNPEQELCSDISGWLFENRLIAERTLFPEELVYQHTHSNLLVKTLTAVFGNDFTKSVTIKGHKQADCDSHDKNSRVQTAQSLDACLTFLRKMYSFPKRFLSYRNDIMQGSCCVVVGLYADIKNYQSRFGTRKML